jgi:cyclopropane fatty-acyl-phospholipid synthase-like methyltransferase
MQRIPEPELMDSPEQTEAYAAADFSEANQLFCSRACSYLTKTTGSLLDLGCGSGGLLVELAHSLPTWRMIGIDAGPNMLNLAQQAIAQARLAHRVSCLKVHLPRDEALLEPHLPFDAIVSNSLLHHLADPMTLWTTISRLTTPGLRVVVMDLSRPASTEQARDLVKAHTQGASPVLQEDFYNSLLAAWRVDEVKDQLDAMGWSHWQVAMVSNRHWMALGAFA